MVRGIRLPWTMCKHRLLAVSVILGICALVFLVIFDVHVMWYDTADDFEVPLEIPPRKITDDGNSPNHDKYEQLHLLTNESSPIWDGIDMKKLIMLRGDISVGGKKDTLTSPVLTSFHPGLNVTYRRLMRTLIGCFMDVAKQHNVTYFLYGGSLIGSYRHHGMIPWDDDFDVAVYVKDKPKLKTIFGALPKQFGVLMPEPRWKLFYNNISNIRNNIQWSFPFLDISFFRVIPQFIVDADPGWGNRFKYKTTDVFPLVLRPFWDRWLPAPRNTRVVLEKTYNITRCLSNSYSHSREDAVKIVYSLPCQKIERFYPHVNRLNSNSSRVVEELVFGGKVVHSVTVLQP